MVKIEQTCPPMRPVKPASKPQQKTPNNADGSLKPLRTSIVSRNIPTSYQDCDDSDKLLVDLRGQGLGWAEIRKRWQTETGVKVAHSTLPNRYARLINSFANIPDDDKALLLRAKREVDRAYQKGKWRAVASLMVEKGGSKHEPDLLQRVYRKMMLEQGLVIPDIVRHADFKDADKNGGVDASDEDDEANSERDNEEDSEVDVQFSDSDD